MTDPEIDLAMIARAQGAHGFGPVTRLGDLAGALDKAVAAVEAGQVAVVDVRVEPGYDRRHDRGDHPRKASRMSVTERTPLPDGDGAALLEVDDIVDALRHGGRRDHRASTMSRST